MHFVYKTDNLSRSMRVSNEKSSITKGFYFLNLFELHTFCVFKMHHSKAHHKFSTISDLIWYSSCIYFCFFGLVDPKIEKHYKWTLKIWKLACYHHFTHIACVKKLRGLRQKRDALRVQNGQSLSKYQGFERELISYKGISFFNLFELHAFCVFKMHHSKAHHKGISSSLIYGGH